MIFHPIEKIQTSKSSWIITTPIDFSPYHRAFVQTRDYVFTIKQMKTDLDLIRSYLETDITGKLTSKIIDPVHLRQELVKIQKQLPPLIHLPEDPTENI